MFSFLLLGSFAPATSFVLVARLALLALPPSSTVGWVAELVELGSDALAWGHVSCEPYGKPVAGAAAGTLGRLGLQACGQK